MNEDIGSFDECVAASLLVHDFNNIDIVANKIMEIKNNQIKDKHQTEKEKIRVWLSNEVKLEHYFKLFTDNGYDSMIAIQTLNETDLLEMGINLKGHRKKLMYFINKLNNASNGPNKNTFIDEFIYRRAQQDEYDINKISLVKQIHNIGVIESIYNEYSHQSTGFIIGRSSKLNNKFYVLTSADAVINWIDEKNNKYGKKK
eukprot:373605_1